MRIAYLGWGGHVHLERWAGHFAGRNNDVFVISLGGNGAFPSGVRQFSLWRLDFSWRLQVLVLKALLWAWRPDVVHVHWAGFAPMLARCWTGPTVVTAWGSDIYRLDEIEGGNKKSILDALRRANLVTVDSIDLAEQVEQLTGMPAKSVAVIQWGVDIDVFHPGPPRNNIARDAGIHAPVVVLSPRNFTPLYNIETIIRAFARMVEMRDDLGLLLKCYHFELDYRVHMESLIVELKLSDRVRVVDRVPYEEMGDFYRSGSVLVSIPDSDGTPVSLLEGMACGCIPVVSDLPSLREWVEHGTNGFLVPPRNVEAVAEGVLTALDRVATDGGDIVGYNLELVRENASQQQSMARMGQFYEAVRAGKQAPFATS